VQGSTYRYLIQIDVHPSRKITDWIKLVHKKKREKKETKQKERKKKENKKKHAWY